MPGMLQAAGDLGFEHESAAAVGIVGVLRLNFLEGDFAAGFSVFGDKHLAQPAAGVRPQDAESHARRRRLAHRLRQRRAEILRRAIQRRSVASDVNQAGLDVGVGQTLQIVASRFDWADCREAALRVAAVLGKMLVDQGFEQLPLVFVESLLAEEDFAERRAFSSTQAFIAATNCSRVTKSICTRGCRTGDYSRR